jgi:hypothetical protein
MLFVRSARPPIVEIDSESAGVYVRFSDKSVAKTIERQSDGPVITVDVDRHGEVVGIEGLCFTEFSLSQILRKQTSAQIGLIYRKRSFGRRPALARPLQPKGQSAESRCCWADRLDRSRRATLRIIWAAPIANPSRPALQSPISQLPPQPAPCFFSPRQEWPRLLPRRL